MPHFPDELEPGSEIHTLLPYVTDLEFEVDRLRRQSRFLEEQAVSMLKRLHRLCRRPPTSADVGGVLVEMKTAIDEFAAMLSDLRQQPGYHPSHDQVIPIAVRPMIEQVFRWQQRLSGVSDTVLRLELDIEHLEWFPARLRHIIDNLLANALQYPAASRGESRITVSLHRTEPGYELRVADNGAGISYARRADMLELFYRARPARTAGVGVGLAVVKALVEQSGGSLTIESDKTLGTCVLAVLPRYDVDDFLERESESPESPTTLAG